MSLLLGKHLTFRALRKRETLRALRVAAVAGVEVHVKDVLEGTTSVRRDLHDVDPGLTCMGLAAERDEWHIVSLLRTAAIGPIAPSEDSSYTPDQRQRATWWLRTEWGAWAIAKANSAGFLAGMVQTFLDAHKVLGHGDVPPLSQAYVEQLYVCCLERCAKNLFRFFSFHSVSGKRHIRATLPSRGAAVTVTVLMCSQTGFALERAVGRWFSEFRHDALLALGAANMDRWSYNDVAMRRAILLLSAHHDKRVRILESPGAADSAFGAAHTFKDLVGVICADNFEFLYPETQAKMLGTFLRHYIECPACRHRGRRRYQPPQPSWISTSKFPAVFGQAYLALIEKNMIPIPSAHSISCIKLRRRTAAAYMRDRTRDKAVNDFAKKLRALRQQASKK